MRFVPSGWSYGQSSSATSGSVDALADLRRARTRTAARSRRGRRRGRSRPSGGRSRRRRSAPRTRARAPRASRPRRSADARSTGCRPTSCAPRGGTRRSGACARRSPRPRAARSRPGTLKFAVRWKTVSCAASAAITGIACTAEDPVPITPTRLPVKSTPSCGQRPVWCSSPANVSRPGIGGTRGTERQPVAMTGTRPRAGRRPRSTTVQRSSASSYAASTTRVPRRRSRRRSKRSATCSM